MNVLFCGSRNWDSHAEIAAIMNLLPVDVTIIHGAARGADMIAHIEAMRRDFSVWEFPADWEKHGKAAGHIRNQQMLDEGEPQMVFAFRKRGDSRGTDDMCRRARAAGLPVVVVTEAYP